MSKRITALLLSVMMVFSMFGATTHAEAANDVVATYTVEANKSSADRGDVVDFTVYMQQTGTMGGFEFTLSIPEGLSYVPGSGALTEEIQTTLSTWDNVEWLEDVLYCQGLTAIDFFTSTEKTSVMTFQCKIDDDAAYSNSDEGKTYEVSLIDLVVGDNHGDGLTSKAVPADITVIPDNVELKVVPDKTEVEVGDTINYTVYIGKIKHFNSAEFAISVPDGLEYVAKSGAVVKGLNEKVGFAQSDWTEMTHKFTAFGIGDYSSEKDTAIITFQCKATQKGTAAVDLTGIVLGNAAYVKYPTTVKKTNVTVAECSHDWTVKKEDTAHYVAGTGLDCQHAKEYYYECSKCHVISTTEKFTSTTKGDHAVNATWTTEGGYHFHKCTVTDCTYVEDKAVCNGGTATCQKKAVCKDCGKEYGALAPHNWTKRVEDAAHQKDAGNCQTNKTYYYGCATEGCNAISTSLYFTSTTKGDHVMDTAWTTEGGYHFHKCTVAGCTHVEDKAACNGGTATCTSKAVCTTCRKEYGSTLDHAYDTEHYQSDATGHWHKCANCPAATNVEPHRPGAAATEETAQTCLDCGYVIAPALGHVHSLHLTHYDANPADCLNDGNKEYYKCDCNKLFLDAAALKETTLEKVTIKAPGHHDWSKKVEDADHYVAGTGLDCQHAKEYYYECSACDAKSTTETFKSTEKGPHSVDTTQWVSDGKSHYHACTVTDCNYRQDVTVCTGGEASCVDKAICDVCHHEYGSLASHVDGNGDEICDVCNGQMEKHNINPTWKYNDYEHWRDCSAGDRHQLTAHEDANNSGRCDVCSYVMNAAAVEAAGATSPQTGDNSMLLLWCVLGISSACVLVCTKRKNA